MPLALKGEIFLKVGSLQLNIVGKRVHLMINLIDVLPEGSCIL